MMSHVQCNICNANRDSLTHRSQGSGAESVEQSTSNKRVEGSYHNYATEFFRNSDGHCRLSSLVLPREWF